MKPVDSLSLVYCCCWPYDVASFVGTVPACAAASLSLGHWALVLWNKGKCFWSPRPKQHLRKSTEPPDRISQRLGVPGSAGVPLLYNLPELIREKPNIYDYYLRSTLKVRFPQILILLDSYCFGSFQYGKVWYHTAPTKPWVYVVHDLESINHILSTNFKNYVKGPQIRQILGTLLGEGIFNTNGTRWKIQRYANPQKEC